ncbi:MAG: hypothetical protein AABW58_04620 [Nanoarchaeota archaeon]
MVKVKAHETREQIEIKTIDRFEVVPTSPVKKKGLVRLLVIPGPTDEGTTFAAEIEIGGKTGFVLPLLCPWYTRTPEERKEAEKAYRKRVDKYFLQEGYTIKDKKLFLDF